MKAPKCRLCGKEHWNAEPHMFPDDKPVKTTIVNTVNTKVSTTLTPKKSVNTRRADDRHSPGYMKSYMRQRRKLKADEKRGVALMKQLAADIRSLH